MLQYETFVNGIASLKKCYRGFNLNREEMLAWYDVIKAVISESEFLPLIFDYCISESAPTCPADIIRLRKKMALDSAPAPAFVADRLFDSTRRMLHSGSYEDLEESKKNLLNDLVMQNPEFRPDNVYVVVVTLVNQYYEVLIDAVRCCERTEISILTSEIKSSYRKELNKTVSYTGLTGSLPEAKDSLLLN